jgi:hypothetical protein
MKVVHVSNFSLRRKSPFFYGIPYKLSNGFTRLGHFVFNFCDRDVADSYFMGIRAVGTSYANRTLIDVCDHIKPDLLLLGHCGIISDLTLNRIRKLIPNIKIAHWNCDALFVQKTFERIYSLAPSVDATFVTTAGPYLQSLAESGGRITFMPNPVDASIETLRVFEKDDTENDLVFLTGVRQYTMEKMRICASIRASIPSLKFDARGLFGNPSVYGSKFFEVLGRSKMAINVSAKNDIHLYSSDRMAQLLGCGLLTFVDRRTGFHTIFRDDELISYESVGDLVEKLVFFKNNDSQRQKAARQGWQRAHNVFSETVVAQWIVDATFRLTHSQAYVWPTNIYGDHSIGGDSVREGRSRVAGNKRYNTASGIAA